MSEGLSNYLEFKEMIWIHTIAVWKRELLA